MKEEATIIEFNVRPRDIANNMFALSESMSKEKLVRKILRSLPKRFNIKVAWIYVLAGIVNKQPNMVKFNG